MSAREPFARVVEDNPESVEPDSVYIGTVRISSHGCPTIAQKHAAAINAAHADRVAAELEAAAEDATEESQSSPLLSPKCVAAWLRARAKARREGGGK